MYKSLQACRAIAAVLVLFYHLGSSIAMDKYYGIPGFSVPFAWGDAGVEFFFVLSGFIILSAHTNDIDQPRKLGTYIKKRLIRIYPVFWIVFLSVYALALTSSELRTTVPHNPFVILKALLLLPQHPELAGGFGLGSPVLGVAWTLHYEMFFYLCFACLIISRWLALGIVVAWLCIYAAYYGVATPPFPFSFLVNNEIWLFGMGMIISWICVLNKVMLKRPLLPMLIGLIMFSVISSEKILNVVIMSEIPIFYGLASSLIILGLVQAEGQGRGFLKSVFEHPWMQLLGDASYSLYLIHFPLISLLCKISILFQLNQFGLVGALIAYVAIFGLCLGVSVIFHLWVEKPITNHLRKRFIFAKVVPSS